MNASPPSYEVLCQQHSNDIQLQIFQYAIGTTVEKCLNLMLVCKNWSTLLCGEKGNDVWSFLAKDRWPGIDTQVCFLLVSVHFCCCSLVVKSSVKNNNNRVKLRSGMVSTSAEHLLYMLDFLDHHPPLRIVPLNLTSSTTLT